MTSGVAGWTRESRSSQRFSNMGGEARSCSVREVPREEASMPPIVPSLGASTPESALDRLRPQVLLERQVAQLASVAGLLEAPERRQRVERRAVDLDLAG